MRLGHHRTGRGATRRDRGAVLVEMSFVAVVLIALLGAAFDFGMSWRAGLGVIEAARTGARVGSSQGNDIDADRALLTGMYSALASSGQLAKVDRVVLFKSTTTDGQVSAACINGTSGSCNTFTGDQFRAITSTSAISSTGCVTNSVRRGYCPTTRNQVQLTADYIGVWVRVKYDPLFPSIRPMDIERTAVMRLEPKD